MFKIPLMTTIQIRVDAKMKKASQKIIREMGIDMSSAIKMYLRQIIVRKGIPFIPMTENGFSLEKEAEILRASADTMAGNNLSRKMDRKSALEYLKTLA